MVSRFHKHTLCLCRNETLLDSDVCSAASVSRPVLKLLFFVPLVALMQAGGGCRSHIKGFFQLSLFPDEINLPKIQQEAAVSSSLVGLCAHLVSSDAFFYFVWPQSALTAPSPE